MTKSDASINSLLVKFLAVVKKLQSDKTKRTYYKVVAEIKTPEGKEKHAYWFGEHTSFLRQKNHGAGKNALTVECNPKQRAEIKKLVAAYEAAHA